MVNIDDLRPLYRYDHAGNHDFFYTMDPKGEIAPQLGYRFGGIAGFIFDKPQGRLTKPLYRWVRGKPTMHFYTVDPQGEAAVAAGFRPENVAGYVVASECNERLPTSRLLRWYAVGLGGAHFYSTDPGSEGMEALGFRREDIDMGEVFSFDRGGWMRHLDGTQPISALTLPGTHDTATWLYKEYGYTKCQTLTLRAQLDAGIRFIDIRCKYNNDGGSNDLWLFHGISFLRETFQLVVDECRSFLRDHPSECIVMSLKNEAKTYHRHAQFAARFQDYVNRNQDLFHTGTRVPALDQVRGKIVLFRRFEASGVGIDMNGFWPDNAADKWTNGDSVTYVIQDQFDGYLASNKSKKFDRVRDFFNWTRSTSDMHTVYINFTSGTGGVWPRTLATGGSGDSFPGTNAKVCDYLADKGPARFGIVPMDFPEYPDDGTLIQKLISLNELRAVVV